MTLALPGHGNTAHSAAQPLRLWFGLPVAIGQASQVMFQPYQSETLSRAIATWGPRQQVLVDWARGYLLLEIGRGSFRSAVHDAMMAAYSNGMRDGKKAPRYEK
jgi:hypothetical protein